MLHQNRACASRYGCHPAAAEVGTRRPSPDFGPRDRPQPDAEQLLAARADHANCVRTGHNRDPHNHACCTPAKPLPTPLVPSLDLARYSRPPHCRSVAPLQKLPAPEEQFQLCHGDSRRPAGPPQGGPDRHPHRQSRHRRRWVGRPGSLRKGQPVRGLPPHCQPEG